MQALGPASWDWQERAHKLVWKFKRVQGGTPLTLKVSWPSCRCASAVVVLARGDRRPVHGRVAHSDCYLAAVLRAASLTNRGSLCSHVRIRSSLDLSKPCSVTDQACRQLSMPAGARNAVGGSGGRIKEGSGPNKPAIHHSHVLRIPATSAVSADS